MKTILEPCIKLKENLNREDYDLINNLQEQCVHKDQIALKLELDYKLGAASGITEKAGMKSINEFLYFDGQQLIGYIGICGFGGPGSPLEVTGMVHPEYRWQGVFSILHELVMAECRRRKLSKILLLCDKKSGLGQKFVEKVGAIYKYSEFEMYLQQNNPEPYVGQYLGVTFRKAANTDAQEIARQNAIYFGDCTRDVESSSGENNSDMVFEKATPQDDMLLLPEEEGKRGMTIYLAEKDEQVIGKVHLQINSAVGGIYGLGVLPEHRGKGFGRAILLRAIEKLKETNIKSIMLQVAAENVTALRLYKSCGFLETSTMDYFELNLK